MIAVGCIPARGGSKGVPGKNIRALGGKPLIAYTIEAALESELLDRVIVSTDSEEIRAVALEFGAEAPFLRPAELSGDRVPDGPVLGHLRDHLKEAEGVEVDLFAYLRPTTPFKTASLIDRCLRRLIENESLQSIRTVTQAEGGEHPFWMYRNEGDRLSPFIEGIDVMRDYPNRQSLPPCLRLNGVVDVIRADNLESGVSIYGNGLEIGFELVEADLSLDIDSELDFIIGEALMGEMSRRG